MSTDFGRVFSSLRKERGLSQRQVANDLEISQALLSHYENGLREPRLDFISTICDYYGVSADYLLGRTEMRNNFSAVLSPLPIDADALLGAMSASLLAVSEDEKLTKSAEKYLSGAIYRLLCELMPDDGRNLTFNRESMALSLMAMAESEIKTSDKMGKTENETLRRCAEKLVENMEKQLFELSKASLGETVNERTE